MKGWEGCWQSFRVFFPDAVVVQPGDQLLSQERRTDSRKAARADGGVSLTQSKCQAVFGAWKSLTEDIKVANVGP